MTCNLTQRVTILCRVVKWPMEKMQSGKHAQLMIDGEDESSALPLKYAKVARTTTDGLKGVLISRPMPDISGSVIVFSIS